MLAAFLSLAACAHAPAVAPRRCLTVVGLTVEGSALVQENAETLRYHLQRPNDRFVQTFSAPECVARDVCDERGRPDLEALELEPAEKYLAAESAPPAAVELELAELGRSRVSLSLADDRFGGKVFRLELEREGRPPEVDQLYPAELRPARVRFLRAGDVLWTELRRDEHACAVLRTDLRALVSRALDSDGVELLRKGRPEEAERSLRRAVEVNPRDATAHYNLACALALSGRLDEAVASLKTALSLDDRRLKAVAREDPDLDALRGRADFDQLVAPRGLDATP